MKNLCTLLFLVFVPPLLRGQASPPAASPDSLRGDRIILRDPGIATGKPTFFIPPRFINDLNIVLPSSVDDGNAFLPGSRRFPFRTDDKVDLISPLRLQWERDDKLGTLKTILGSMTFGGAAYLAVRSLQKNDAKPPLPRQIRTNKP